MTRPVGRFVGNLVQFDGVYGQALWDEAGELVELLPPVAGRDVDDDPSLLGDVDLILGTWGMPKLTADLLAAAPRLKAVFYAAGSIKGFMTEAAWDRDLVVTSAYAGNAVPVAEMTLSQILFSLKLGWQHALSLKRNRQWKKIPGLPGAFGSTVGLVSLGAIGRLVVEHLSRFDVQVIAYDIHEDPELTQRFGVRYVPLDELFATADVVSLHTPWLPETVGMIDGSLLGAMKRNATFINTARGAVVNEPDLIDVLQRRDDLVAVLDVTYPEPPASDSPLWTLPNVILLPHIAGSLEGERRRMGRMMIDELRRHLAGEPLLWRVTPEQAATMA